MITEDNHSENKRVFHKHPNGTTYVYEILHNVWDPEKKQSRNSQRCIGKLDPETGEFIPSKRLGAHGAAALDPAVTARTSISGPALLLNQIGKDIGLEKTLKKACPRHWDQILSLAWYLVCEGNALSHAKVWCRHHEVPTDQVLTSQRISDLLSEITEDERQTFFKLWGRAMVEKDYLCYDITSVSSYAEQNEYVRYGTNRDGEKLPQINLGIVYGQMSFLPVIYRPLPGSLTDVKTLRNLLDQLDKLSFPKVHLILDRGFWSQENIDELAKGGYHFTVGVPCHLKLIREEMDRFRHQIDGPEGLRWMGQEAIYVHSRLLSWQGSRRRCYLHLTFDPEKMAEDYSLFDTNLLTFRDELEQGKRVPEHEEAYQRFFICHETPKRGLTVNDNGEAIEAARKKQVGFSAILSTKFKDPLQALTIYRGKDGVEKCFDDLKNELDMKRLRVHRSDRMNNRLFIQFMALILISYIHQMIREKLPKSGYTAKGILMELESLTTIHDSGRYKSKLSEATKAQKDIFQAFHVMIDS